MSVCIAVLCNNSKNLVTVSDFKVGFGDFAADNLAIKETLIDVEWVALFAGNDIEHAQPIVIRAREIVRTSFLQSFLDKKKKLELSLPEDAKKAVENTLGHEYPSPEDVANAVDQAYSERLHSEIEKKVLRKRGFDTKTFLDMGKQKCTPAAYLSLCSRIDQIKISLKFLVCGFGSNGDGHIYLVDGESAPKCYDPIGMWAIGTGAHAALSSLAFHAEKGALSIFSPAGRAVYFATAAKFMAESSAEVGKGTTTVSTKEKGKEWVYVPFPRVEKIRALWEKQGAPQVPNNLDEEMKDIERMQDMS